MASMYHKPEAATWTCDTPRCGNTLSRKDEGAECHECDKTICDGCTYECLGCSHSFCLEHIVVCCAEATNFDALYVCGACLAEAKVAA